MSKKCPCPHIFKWANAPYQSLTFIEGPKFWEMNGKKLYRGCIRIHYAVKFSVEKNFKSIVLIQNFQYKYIFKWLHLRFYLRLCWEIKKSISITSWNFSKQQKCFCLFWLRFVLWNRDLVRDGPQRTGLKEFLKNY